MTNKKSQDPSHTPVAPTTIVQCHWLLTAGFRRIVADAELMCPLGDLPNPPNVQPYANRAAGTNLPARQSP